MMWLPPEEVEEDYGGMDLGGLDFGEEMPEDEIIPLSPPLEKIVAPLSPQQILN